MAAVQNFFDPASKATPLGVLRREIDGTFALGEHPGRREAPTACEDWEVRDVIAHLVDTTEGYLPAFEPARRGGTAPAALGLQTMARHVDESAKAFRKVPARSCSVGCARTPTAWSGSSTRCRTPTGRASS